MRLLSARIALDRGGWGGRYAAVVLAGASGALIRHWAGDLQSASAGLELLARHPLFPARNDSGCDVDGRAS